MASKTSKKQDAPSGFTKLYLFSYNFVQVVGWSCLLFLIVRHYIEPGRLSLWERVRIITAVFQFAAILEVFHALFRLVNSNPIVTFFQVISRVNLVVVWWMIPVAVDNPGLPLALVAWSITEIVRYLFYALSIIGSVPYVLVWCRYTFFILLYPIGVTGELLCLYAAQAYVANTKMWCLEMPNVWNFTLSYHYGLLIGMVFYIPGFPQLYLHMFNQRRKIIGGDSKKKQ